MPKRGDRDVVVAVGGRKRQWRKKNRWNGEEKNKQWRLSVVVEVKQVDRASRVRHHDAAYSSRTSKLFDFSLGLTVYKVKERNCLL